MASSNALFPADGNSGVILDQNGLILRCERRMETSVRDSDTCVMLRNSVFLVSLLFLTAVSGVCADDSIPPGTILPVGLNSTLSSTKCKPGQVITARVMQDLPPRKRMVIRSGAKVIGHILHVTAGSNGTPASLSFRFDSLETRDGQHSVTTGLRAIASFTAVHRAQLPRGGADRGTPENAWTTVQIGGDIVYRGGGYVEAHRERVGKPVPGGVLSRLQSNPERGCAGALDTSEARQALWLFSSDACGTYDLPSLRIRRTEGPNSSGEIILDSAKGQVNVRAGAGLLLAVNSAPGA